MIQVRNLSKSYRTGGQRGQYRTLRESLAGGIGSMVNHLRYGVNGTTVSDKPSPRNDQVQVLKDVSFDVGEGEAIGVIGHNGAGKSTLLKIMSRITEPSSGRVVLRGRVGSLLEVGTGFHPELTGRENIHLNGAILGMTREEITKQFDKIVDFAEIEAFLDTPVKRYSSGMYVRLGFSVAAHMTPDVLLIDEVLAVGDLRFQRKCMDFARSMTANCGAVLLVSHNMFSIKSLCRRAIYLSHGQIQFDGNAEDAIAMYEKDSRLKVLPWAESQLGTDPTRLQVSLGDIETFDELGRKSSVFKHGERVRVRINYENRSETICPNFVVAFVRSDNIGCCNFSTELDGFPISQARGPGTIELMTPPMKLVSDHYSIHVLVRDRSFQRLFSAQIGPTIHISDELLSNHFGIFHEKGEWAAIQ
jgi:lipopolysaccharide transport system ATP-binding protein